MAERRMLRAGYRESPLIALEYGEQIERFRELSIAGPPAPSGSQQQGYAPGFAAAPASGGFSYAYSTESAQLQTRNRFIIWRTSDYVVELIELSLDMNLRGNSLRLRFPAPVLPEIAILESESRIYVFVATSARTLHRLTFAHPAAAQAIRHAGQVDSIFASVDVGSLRPWSYNICKSARPTTMCVIHETQLVFGCENGNLVAVRLNGEGDMNCEESELTEATMMKRLWSGLLPAFSRASSAATAVTSIVAYPFGDDLYLLTLTGDHRLRIWSLGRREVLASYVLAPSQGSAIASALRLLPQSDTAHLPDPSQLCLAAQLTSIDGSEFLTVQVTLQEPSGPPMIRAEVSCRVEGALSAWHVSNSQLWALTMQRLPSLAFATRTSNAVADAGRWQEAVLTREPPELDASEENASSYLHEIFSPGRFTPTAIARAIRVLSEAAGEDAADEQEYQPQALDYHSLRDGVVSAVSRFALRRREAVAVVHWQRMWHECLRCWRDDHAPLGLFLNEYTGVVCLLKKGGISFLRPADNLELSCAVLSEAARSRSWDLMEQKARQFFESSAEFSVAKELVQVLSAATVLGEQLALAGGSLLARFEEQLFALVDPTVAAGQALDAAALQAPELVARRMARVPSCLQSTQQLLAILVRDRAAAVETPPANQRLSEAFTSGLFAGGLSEVLVAFGFFQNTTARFRVARDLFFLLLVVQKLPREASFTQEQQLQLQKELLPALSGLVRCFFVMKWLGLQLLPPSGEQTDQLAAFAGLDLGGRPSMRLRDVSEFDYHVVQVYYRELLPVHLQKQFAFDGRVHALLQQGAAVWDTFQPLLSLLTSHLWCTRDNVPELTAFVLLMIDPYRQTALVQVFIRLLQTDLASLQYLLGVSYLADQAFEKAKECFCRAAAGVDARDPYFLELCRRRSTFTDEAETDDVLLRLSADELRLRYYLAILQHFDSYKRSSEVVEIAQIALAGSQSHAQERGTPIAELHAILYANVFTHCLLPAKKDYDLAYDAMMKNPDPERQNNCLRRFVVVCCENNEVRRLCDLPFELPSPSPPADGQEATSLSLLEEVDRILYEKASRLDIAQLKPNYYQILYAFHMRRGVFRPAATLMCEYAQRLAQESHTMNAGTLQEQANCYLAAITTFRLIDPRNAWAVRAAHVRPHKIESPKRKREVPAPGVSRPADVLELSDLEREYFLIRCLLLLHRRLPQSTIRLEPADAFRLLVQHGCFDSALTFAKLYNRPQDRRLGIDKPVIFESLTRRCLQLQLQSEANGALIATGPDDEEWLHVAEEEVTGSHGNAARAGWALLQRYLQAYDGPQTNHGLHLRAAQCVLLTDANIELPRWLLRYLWAHNAPAALRLLMSFDLLEDALETARHILATPRSPLNSAPPRPMSRYVPYHLLEQLQQLLQRHVEDPRPFSRHPSAVLAKSHQMHYRAMLTELTGEIERVLAEVTEASAQLNPLVSML